MQVARTNRWSALGTVAGLIASGIGANWAAMVISAAASPITLMPITGLPLPWISYGGSGVVTFFALVGLVQNVHMRRYR